MSKLLINEHPLMVLPSLAAALKSVNSAIVLQQIHYWISDHRAPLREGVRWHFATFEEWLKQFPWLSLRGLKKIVAALEESGLIISKEFNRHGGDRTKWYTLNYKALERLELSLNTHSAQSALPLGTKCTTIVHKVHDVYKEEETTEETIKETTTTRPVDNSNPNRKADNVVVSFFDEIKLSEKDRSELLKNHPENYLLEKIELFRKEKGIQNPIPWYLAAVKKDFKASVKAEVGSFNHEAKTKEIIASISSLPEKSSEVTVGKNFLDQCRGALGISSSTTLSNLGSELSCG